mmetsp:Transcript_12042/g.54685  ORF Transcript_12042/g.54685 Transcript_12042/m.54685 type:complete len:274 (-) Transcript_12042:732-1553(-)
MTSVRRATHHGGMKPLFPPPPYCPPVHSAVYTSRRAPSAVCDVVSLSACPRTTQLANGVGERIKGGSRTCPSEAPGSPPLRSAASATTLNKPCTAAAPRTTMAPCACASGSFALAPAAPNVRGRMIGLPWSSSAGSSSYPASSSWSSFAQSSIRTIRLISTPPPNGSDAPPPPPPRRRSSPMTSYLTHASSNAARNRPPLESVTIANPVLSNRPDPDPFVADTSSRPAATPGAQKSTTLSSYTTWNAGHDPVRSAPYTETSASRHAPRRRSSH